MLIRFLFSVEVCPSPWYIVGDSCILVGVQQATWQEASDYCIGEGAHLPIFENAEENTVISSKFQMIFVFKKFIFYFEKELSD